MTPGQTLRAWRKSRRLSQKDAALAAGISQAAWCEYENDEKLPRVQQAVALARLTADDEHSVTVDMFAAAEKAREDARSADDTGTHRAPSVKPTGTDSSS
jgi:transcriptional regulator with XRE-family HTH domain